MSRKQTSPRQNRQAKSCLFCGAAGKLTDEHIYGDWLRKLGFNGDGVREIIPGDGAAPIIQKGGPFSKKLAVVCRTCNNGWMSQLETAAKPILISLFDAAGAQVALNEEAQLVLARWAFKTAAVAALVTNSSHTIPEAHRRELYLDDRPPRSAHIRLGTASISTHTQGHQLAEYRFEPRTGTVTWAENTAHVAFYRATLRLLTVVFDLFGYVTEGVDLAITPSDDLARALLPLWPTPEPKIWWPPTVSLDVIGGMPGLTAAELMSVPTFMPPSPQ